MGHSSSGGPLLTSSLNARISWSNRGHYFGTAEFNETANLSSDERSFGRPALSEDDKLALIEFLKTF